MTTTTTTTTTCSAGLPLTSNGRYADVIRVYLWPTDDDHAPVATSVLVAVDTSGGYGLGEETAISEAVDFADAFDGADEHLGWINWRPEDEGPAVEIVLSPSSPGGPRPGERGIVCTSIADSLRSRRTVTYRDSEAVAPDADAWLADLEPAPAPAPFNPAYDPNAASRLQRVADSMESDGFYDNHSRDECAAEVSRRLALLTSEGAGAGDLDEDGNPRTPAPWELEVPEDTADALDRAPVEYGTEHDGPFPPY